MSGFFITGTDTEIGKTFVSTLLIRLLVEDGLQVVGMKPIASDATKINGELQNEDALALMAASNVAADYKTINPYVFYEAVSPHIAAAKEKITIDLDIIKNCFDQLEKKSDVVVVEGVGGWYAPLSLDTTVSDLAKTLQLPIILVVGLRLGCLNHASLTAQAIRQSGLPIAGWVANHIEDHFSYVEQNIQMLKESLNDVPFLGSVPYQKPSNEHALRHVINKQALHNTLKLKK